MRIAYEEGEEDGADKKTVCHHSYNQHNESPRAIHLAYGTSMGLGIWCVDKSQKMKIEPSCQG